jgi:hypothetical protein
MKVRLMKGVLAVAVTVASALVFAPGSVSAQTSTGTIRGFVKDAQGQPIVGVSVTATQPETNFQRSVITTQTGFYNIPGLQPSQYVVTTSMVGYANQERSIRVLIGQTLNLDLTLSEQAIALEGIRVEATRTEAETRTTEVATNITREQIENVPLVDRNFLSLATLAPGVKREGGSITSGGQSMNNVNVFVDGITFKADLLQGGVAGQDASKGNPFPQVAVQEFRVITQQYKAEYQKASSAIITATTKSGTNEWHGDVFLFRQNKDLINQDFIALRTCTEGKAANPDFVCAEQAKLDKWQGGGSFGGPLMRDRLFVFGAYEGNHQTRAFTTTLGTPANLPPADVLAQLRTHEGTRNSPFRSNLYFGKLTYTPASAHRFEASVNIRDEYDIRNFGGTDSYDNAEHFNNDVNTFALRHQFASGNLLNEASVSYQSVRWHPIPLFEEQVGIRYQGVLKIGGRSTMQDFDQQRLSFRNDISYTKAGWLGDHVFKLGGNFDFLDYDIIRPLNGNPEFRFDSSNDWAFPFEAVAGFGNPDLSADNEQLGVYIQDDWTPTPRLAFNLGIRWDFETGMLNNDWVTPDSIRQFVAQYVTAQGFRCDGTDDPKRAQLCEADRYMTDGDDRPSFKKAFQPRVGLSYDLRGDGNTVLFGGFGIYYDRNRYNVALSEYANLQWLNYTFRFSSDGLPRGGNPTMVWDPSFLSREGLQAALAQGAPARPELFLLENKTTPPNSRHFTAGVRQSLGMMQLTANYTGVRGYNILTWIRANRNVNGTCCANFPVGTPASAFKFTNVFVSSDDARSWYDAMYLKAEKRYSENSKWGAQLSYTLSYTDEEANVSDVFSALDFFTEDFVRYTSRNDERHRITGNWIIGLPFDIRFSGLLELATPKPFNATYGFGPGTNNCTHGNLDCVGGNDWPEGKARFWWRPDGDRFLGIDGFAYRNVDLRLEKEFPTLRGQRIGLVGEVFNVFDHPNFTGFNLNVGNYQSDGTIQPNATFGRPTSVFTTESGGPRRYQLGLRYTF